MLAAVHGGQVRVAGSARREPPRGLTLMKTSRFLAGLPYFSATKARGGRLRGRARISEPTAPRRRKRAVDQVIESSHHTVGAAYRVAPAREPQHAPNYGSSIAFVKTIMFSLCFRHDQIRIHIRNCRRQPRADHLCAGERSGNKQQRACPICQTRAHREGWTRTYQPEQWVPDPSDTYAWAVMSVGPGALLYGESVIAMLNLAPTNPPACLWQLLDEHGESFRIASKSNG